MRLPSIGANEFASATMDGGLGTSHEEAGCGRISTPSEEES